MNRVYRLGVVLLTFLIGLIYVYHGTTPMRPHLWDHAHATPHQITVAVHFSFPSFLNCFLFVQPKPRHASGYILFASEVRASTKQHHPDLNFGEISRLIGSDVSKSFHAACSHASEVWPLPVTVCKEWPPACRLQKLKGSTFLGVGMCSPDFQTWEA